MDFLLALLKPSIITTYGPLAVIAIVQGAALYYLFKQHQTLHEARREDIAKMVANYTRQTEEINHTLDLLVQVISGSKKK